jgi:hypothetical protein
MLRLELGDLKELDFDLTLTGFDEIQLGAFLAWRYARHLGRTTAERIAVFNVEMGQLERRGADAVRSHAKRRGTFVKTKIGVRPTRGRRRLS